MRTSLILLAFALSVAAQPLPLNLRQAKMVPVAGVVTAVNSSQIVVSNFTTSIQQGSRTTFARVGGRLTPIEVPGRAVSVVSPAYIYLKNYPDWTQVRVGDRMATVGYLLGDAGGVKTVQWYKPPTNAPPAKIWN